MVVIQNEKDSILYGGVMLSYATVWYSMENENSHLLVTLKIIYLINEETPFDMK